MKDSENLSQESNELESVKKPSPEENSNLCLNNICASGHTFLWDLLITYSALDENSSSDTLSEPGSNNSDEKSDISMTNKNKPLLSLASQQLKILKEAEKQLQTLLCLPSTDRRIRIKFIENCLLNLKSNNAGVFSLRLLTKLFSSFQQYSSNPGTSAPSSTNTSPNFTTLNKSHPFNLDKSPLTTISQTQEKLLLNPGKHHHHHHHHHHHQQHNYSSSFGNVASNIVEVHKIVALTEYNFAMMNIFFENLGHFSSEKMLKLNSVTGEKLRLDILNEIRLGVQARLQFLSFVFSTLGSPRDFELTRPHVEMLWDCLVQFGDSQSAFVSIRDDLFNWFLNQAKSKDQHAINIETFRLIFVNKMPYLDPNSFSQTALHLYQELFKIYKYSFQQQLNSNENENTKSLANQANFKQIESSAIDYIWKLAFKSANKDVSLAAIQFLNSHYIQSDTITNVGDEIQFTNRCMNYLKEACHDLKAVRQSNSTSRLFLLINEERFDSKILGKNVKKKRKLCLFKVTFLVSKKSINYFFSPIYYWDELA